MRISDWSSDVCSSDLSDAEFAAWGWRIPFLVSAVLVGLGLWVRLKIRETPAFAEAMEKEPPVGVPMGELLRSHALTTLAGTFAVVACRSEEHTSELQSLMRISYAVFCLKKKKHIIETHNNSYTL